MKLLIILGMTSMVMAGCTGEYEARNLDYWGQNCPASEYAVYDTREPIMGRSNYSCENARSCNTDADCRYLDIDNLPPRVGVCNDGICKAQCGSGRAWNC